MKLIRCLTVILSIMIPSAAVRAAGEYSMWFGDASGSDITVINAPNNQTFDVYVWMSSTVGTWYIDAAVGFDRANSAGAGTVPIDGKIVLASGVPGVDLVWGQALSLYPTDINRGLAGFYKSTAGTRPYGADLACANMSGTTGPLTKVRVARVSLRSQLSSDGTYKIVLWNDGGNTAGGLNTMAFGSNPCYGVSDTLLVSGTVNPVVGANNKSVLNAIMSSAASKYDWILWGRVTVIDADNFSIDDGSGVSISVVCPSHTVTDGHYVAVRGTLDAATRTLTSRQITKYN